MRSQALPSISGRTWTPRRIRLSIRSVFDNTSFAAATSSMLTVGYLVWMVRAGALLSTFVSSMPAWQTFDPLPVIESGIGRKFSDDEDTLERIVDNE